MPGWAVFLIVLAVILVVVLIVTVIVWTVRIAEGKNRSTGLWCFLALFLGIVALLVIECLPEQKPHYVATAANHFNNPQKVGTGYSTGVRKTNVAYKPYNNYQQVSGWICPNCGEKNVAEAHACIFCGTPRD